MTNVPYVLLGAQAPHTRGYSTAECQGVRHSNAYVPGWIYTLGTSENVSLRLFREFHTGCHKDEHFLCFKEQEECLDLTCHSSEVLALRAWAVGGLLP